MKVINSEKSIDQVDDQVRCAEFIGGLSFNWFALVQKLFHFPLVAFLTCANLMKHMQKQILI
jgi:hypothetical protein